MSTYKSLNLVLAKDVLSQNRGKMYLQIIVTLRFMHRWTENRQVIAVTLHLRFVARVHYAM